MKNIFKIAFLVSIVSFFTSCETVELDLLENPNNITVESADPNFVLNDISLDFNGIVGGYSGTDQVLTRMRNLFGTYPGAVTENTVAGEWATSYSMFSNIDLLQGINDFQISEGGEGIPNHVGIAQVIEAYAYMLLVDHVGDVPFSEANQPEDFPNPRVDDGRAVYDAQLELLDAAIVNLNTSVASIPTDLYYGEFDPANWTALANTLKIRAYVNMRLVNPDRARTGINQVIGTGSFINTLDEDFQFNYNTTVSANSDGRSPIFAANYGAGGAGGYMSNYLYDIMNAGDDQGIFIETGDPDPRVRYYFYRQTGNEPSGSNLPCEGDGRYDYCYVGNLYWGRDHTDDAGIPADGNRRTTFGVYPAGGAFDADNFLRAPDPNLPKLDGAGINPIYTSANTHFALAEAALTLGTGGGSPAALLEQGIRLHMDKVLASVGNLPTTNPDTGDDFAATQAQVNDYVNRVINEFNTANNDGKLDIIARENLIASFGNGIEPYNTYRRTGGPTLQSPIIAAGTFPRAWRYPENEVNNNPNISQQPLTTRVFWDNNPGGFID